MQKLSSIMRAAVDRYNMIDEGDRIGVGVSGGKDSLALLMGLAHLRRYYPKKFELVALTADPCFFGEDSDFSQIENLCRSLDIQYIIRRTELYHVVFEEMKSQSPCSLCAKMRRGILHNMAKDAGCNKIALGHHSDDAAETSFLHRYSWLLQPCYLSFKQRFIYDKTDGSRRGEQNYGTDRKAQSARCKKPLSYG